MRLRIRATRACAVTAAVALAMLATPVAADSAPARRPTAGSAVVRTAHFSPDTPGVDVYLTSFSGSSNRLWQSNVGYGDVTSYRSIKPGLYVVAMRVHGAPASSPPGLRWTLKARAGKAYTVAAVGMNKNLTGVVLRDTLRAPANGHGLVRIIQASSRAARAKLVAEPDTVLASNVRFPSSTGYRNVRAGRWTLQATSLDRSVSTTKSVRVKAGSISSVVVLDARHKGIALRTVADAAGAATAPQGSIDAGGGGTATRVTSGGLAVPAYLGLAVLVLGTAGVRRWRTVRG